MRKIILSKEEYKYLIYCLLENNKAIVDKISSKVGTDDTVELELDDDTTYDIWQLAEDKIMDCFDENYEPTKEGWIIEHFLDKFYW
jgi:hypothetical protein